MREITTQDELDLILESDKPVFLFKHSTRCPISSRANMRVEDYVAVNGEGAAEFILLKVVESRSVSLAAADALRVEHESPQLILVKLGKALWHTSHGGIRDEAINEAIEAHLNVA